MMPRDPDTLVHCPFCKKLFEPVKLPAHKKTCPDNPAGNPPPQRD